MPGGAAELVAVAAVLLGLAGGAGGGGVFVQPPDVWHAADVDVALEPHLNPHRFLAYARDAATCAGVQHQRTALRCALVEAWLLNRTFVLDDEYCTSATHTGAGRRTRSDIAEFYDLDLINSVVNVVRKSEFERISAGLSVHQVGGRFDHSLLLGDQADIILRSPFTGYWGSNCKRTPAIARLWNLPSPFQRYIQPPKRVFRAVREIVERGLGGDFDAIHVRRGDKANNPRVWPNLDRDTRGEALASNPNVISRIRTGRRLWIATNEYTPGFFRALQRRYVPMTALGNFSTLLARYNIAPRSYLHAHLDFLVWKEGRVRLETFNDLTSDPKRGVA